jgi:hypothetical protein
MTLVWVREEYVACLRIDRRVGMVEGGYLQAEGEEERI